MAAPPQMRRRHSAGGEALHHWHVEGKLTTIHALYSLAAPIPIHTLARVVQTQLLDRFPRLRGHISEDGEACTDGGLHPSRPSSPALLPPLLSFRHHPLVTLLLTSPPLPPPPSPFPNPPPLTLLLPPFPSAASYWVIPPSNDADKYIKEISLQPEGSVEMTMRSFVAKKLKEPLPASQMFEVLSVSVGSSHYLLWRFNHTAADGVILTQIMSQAHPADHPPLLLSSQ